VEYAHDQKTACIVLSDPSTMNALDRQMVATINDHLRALAEDDRVRVVMLRGDGGHFCSGASMTSVTARTQAGGDADALVGELEDLHGNLARALRDFPKVTVARVDGVCAGAGIGVALACDVVYAADNARFVFTFLRRGLVPDYGLTELLPSAVGRARSAKLLLLGEEISGATAYEMGMVSAAFPPSEMEPELEGLVAQLAAGPRMAQSLTKGLLNEERRSGDRIHAEFQSQAICLQGPEAAEGVVAFRERRAPQFLDIDSRDERQ
jgi:enoyl-CoA hydratase/carnithine racemase